MTHDEAAQLATELMAEHGLTARGWRFTWSRGKRQLGRACIRKHRDPHTGRTVEDRTISLSTYLVALNSDEEIRDTILHEIAHALAGLDHGHDETWQAMCRKVGAKPQRLAGKEVRLPPAPLVMVCGCCREVLGSRHRYPTPSVQKRYMCRACGQPSMGKVVTMPRAQVEAENP